MPLTPPDPYELIAGELKTIIDTEFAPESIVAINDNIHESLGEKRVTVGIAPVRDVPDPVTGVAGNYTVEIRFYDLWEKKVDPEQSVNPINITNKAERLKRAIRIHNQNRLGSAEAWFFNWAGTEYVNDPTGNKTRFHMTVVAYSDNTALVETSG